MTAHRTRFGYANVTATLALVVALGGTAHAAGLITGADVKNGSLSGKDVKDHSLKRADLGAGVVVPPGANLPAGVLLRGVFSPTSGSVSPGDTSAGESVSFAFPLAAGPRAHVVLPDSEPIAACPGTLAAPLATSGHLCLYVEFEPAGVSQVTVLDPASTDLRGINLNVDTNVETVFGDGASSRFGFAFSGSDSTNVMQMNGSWAVRG